MPDRIDFLNDPQVNFFGAFYPVGYAVLAFRDKLDAEKVKTLWGEAGHAEGDATVVLARQLGRVEGGTTKDNGANVGGVAEALQGETKIMDQHRELADEGATFLMVYAPDDETTDQLAAILTAFAPLSAIKYDPLTIRSV
ncbi:MAG: hypothetical protein H7232_18780 [Aeromicrobium sp.]|nr:hypothetical protein [Burkholderiales bacterium]